jgi:hypothetical protein
MELEDFEDILNLFEIEYKVLRPDLHGTIDYDEYKIELNLRYNDDGLTLCHELAHYFLDEIVGIQNNEYIVEEVAKDFYLQYKDCVDDYLYKIKHPKEVLKAYLSLQEKEIKEHKWYMNETLDDELSYNEVVYDWAISGHAERFENTYNNHFHIIKKLCDEHCGGMEYCKNVGNCDLETKIVHQTLED